MANQYRRATLKFSLRNDFARPKALEVERFLKEEAKIPPADMIGIHFSILSNTFFVKLINDAACDKFLRAMKPGLRFCHPDGNVSNVEVDHLGLGLRTIRIFELPFELPAAEVEEALSPYGTVLEHVAEKWTQFKTYPVLNGVRQVRIELRRHVPSYLQIGGCRAVIIYDGQPKTCSGCGKEGHLRSECPQRKITQLPPRETEPTPTPTVLPVTYAAALTRPPPVPTQSSTVTEPEQIIVERSLEDQSALPATEIPTTTTKPPTTGDTDSSKMSFDSPIIPTEAFVPVRRASVPSSDAEAHVRKQRSPKRRKRRRRNLSDRDSSHSLESEDLVPLDTNDEADSVAADPAPEERRVGQATDVRQSLAMNTDQQEDFNAGCEAERTLPNNRDDLLEHEQTSATMTWADETGTEQDPKSGPSEASPGHPV